MKNVAFGLAFVSGILVISAYFGPASMTKNYLTSITVALLAVFVLLLDWMNQRD